MTAKKEGRPLPSPPDAAPVSALYEVLTKGQTDLVVRLSRVQFSGLWFIRAEARNENDPSSTVVTYLGDEQTSSEVLGQIGRALLPQALPPAIREWALPQHTEEEIVAGLREVREKGGPDLGELIHELEQGTDHRE